MLPCTEGVEFGDGIAEWVPNRFHHDGDESLGQNGLGDFGKDAVGPSGHDLLIPPQHGANASGRYRFGCLGVVRNLPHNGIVGTAAFLKLTIDSTGHETSHSNTVGFQLFGYGQCQHSFKGLRGGIGGNRGTGAHVSHDGRDNEDPSSSSSFHVGTVEIAQGCHRHSVDIDHGLERLRIGVDKFSRRCHTGVVDQNVHVQTGLLGDGKDLFGSVLFGQVGTQHTALDTVAAFNVVGQSSQPLHIPCHQYQWYLPPGQLHGNGSADTLRCTRYQRVSQGSLVLQPFVVVVVVVVVVKVQAMMMMRQRG